MCCRRSDVLAVVVLCLLIHAHAWSASEVHADFQPSSGTTAAGYVAVTNSNRWDNGTSVDLGGGVRGAWLDYLSVHTGDRGASYPDLLNRDFIQWNGSDTPETFKMTGIQQGTYNLKIYAWDPQYNDKRTQFAIDQNNDSAIDQTVTIENTLGEKNKTVSVTVSAAGVLSITVSRIGSSAGAICGLDLTDGAPDTTAPAAVADLAAASIEANQLTLTWTASGDDGNTGTAYTYSLRYSNSPIMDESTFSAATAISGLGAPKASGTGESFTVTGLAADTTYYFALKVADEVPNWSGLSNVVQVKTLPPHTWDPTDIGSELWAWGWAGTNGQNLTLVDGPNGKLIARMVDLSGRGHDFVGEPTSKPAYQAGLTLSASAKGGAYSTALPLIGLDAYTGGAQVYGNVYNHDAPLLASGEFYLATVCMNTRTSGIRELFGRSEQDCVRIDQGSNSLEIAVAGTIKSLGASGAVPAGMLLLEIERDAAGSVTARANGLNLTPTPVALPGLFTLAGEGYDGTGSSQWDDYWMEIVICEALPTAAERDSLRAYLAGKWSVTLADVTVPTAVSNLAATAIGGTQLTLTWTASGDDGSTGTASSYDLRYSTAPITDDASFAAATALTGLPAPQAASSGQSFTVTGLAEDTKYYFALKVADEVPNWSGLSNIISATTLSPVTTVAIDYSDAHKHQTWMGWDASAPSVDLPDFLKNQVVDVLVNDLGLNRLRLQAPSRRDWEDRANDNGDPLAIDWNSFDSTPTDIKIEEWFLPFKAAVEARGEPFGCYVSPSFYNGSVTGPIPVWMLNNPGEYAEWAQALLYHLKTKYNFVPDEWSICNEAGNNNNFTPTLLGRIVKVLGPRMQAMGLPTKIQFSEGVSSNATWNYVQPWQTDAEIWKYVGLLTYHLYGEHWSSPSPDMRATLYAFAQAHNLPTGQTEFMDADTDDIYEDLTIGGVSVWEQFQACAQGKGDVAGSGSYMTARYDGCSFIRGPAFWDFRQFMHYIRPGAVRVDATSTDTNLKTVAFLKDGKITVVLLNNYTGSTTQTIRITGLPAGQYGLCQTVNRAVYAELGIQTVGADGVLATSIAQGAVMTLYPYAGSNMAPILNDWTSSNHFLSQSASTTTLSTLAVDPELNPLTYAWTIVSQPAGANVILATPSSATCAVSGMTVAGDYLFNTAVSDGSRTTNRQVKVPVLAGNQPPVIGSASTKNPVNPVLPTTTTTLGGGGYDLEGDTLSYLWTIVSQPAGANAVLASPTSSSCGLSGLTVPGTYVFRFQLSDPTHVLTTDTDVYVAPANAHAPTISGAAGQVQADGHGKLSATTSDADGDVISHWWMVESMPTDATVTFHDQGSPNTDVWVNVTGTYKFRLVVVDRTLYTESSQITMNLTATAGPWPGDLNGDGHVNVSDLLVLVTSWGKTFADNGYNRHADINNDTYINVGDLQLLVANWGR